MPGEPGNLRPPLPHCSSSANTIREFATSNSTSNYFLGTTQRSWMTGGGGGTGGGGSTAFAPSRVFPPDVNRSGVNQHAQGSHSPSTTHGEGKGEGRTTTPAGITLQEHFPTTASGVVPTLNSPGSVQSGQNPSVTTAMTVPMSTRPRYSNLDAESNLVLGASIHTRRPASATPTHSNSAPTTRVPIETLQNPSLVALRQVHQPQSPSHHTTLAGLNTLQPVKSLQLSAGAAISPIMAPSPQHTQSTTPAVTHPPTVVSPVVIQTPVPASRKRPGDPLFEGRRTRPEVYRPAVSQIPTPSTTPVAHSGPGLLSQLRNSATRLRETTDWNMVDEQRLSLLCEAFENNDVVYLMIHQVYCASNTHPTLLAGLRFTKADLEGLAMLMPILVSNARLTGGALTLFANFPRQPQCLFEPFSAKILNDVRNFLSAFGKGFNVLRNACKARSYPPSTMELAYAFSLSSPAMQKTLYNSIHRQVSGVNEDFAERAIALFVHDQQQFASRSSVLTDGLVAQDGQRFGQLYLQLRMSSGHWHVPNQQPVPQPRRVSARYPVNSEFLQIPGYVPAAAQLAPSPPVQQYQATRHSASTGLLYPQGPTSPLSALYHTNQGYSTTYNLNGNAPARATNSVAVPSSQTQTQRPHSSRAPSKGTLLQDYLLPRPGIPAVFATNPNPDCVALHQAHLRSPTPRKLDLGEIDSPNLRLYQYVMDFVLEPQKIDISTKFREWHFNIDPADFCHKSHDVLASEFLSGRKVRLYKSGSYLFRLKAITKPAGILEPLSSSDFSVSPVSWPLCCFVSINDFADVELRRRQLHGRDLAADFTDLVRIGDNTIQLSNHSSIEESKKVFFFAVERIHVIDHATIVTMTSKLPAAESLASITAALTGSQDDEISFADPFISIDLIDPFMATVWRTPVRGKTCKHRECFDHQAFLLSRTSRVKNGPTNPDQWMCPICKKDARPQNLVIDEFLVKVRLELETGNQLDARAILVKQDGSWEAKFDRDKKDTTSRNESSSIAKGVAEETLSVSGINLNAKIGQSVDSAANDRIHTSEAMANGAVMPPSETAAEIATETTIIEIDDD